MLASYASKMIYMLLFIKLIYIYIYTYIHMLQSFQTTKQKDSMGNPSQTIKFLVYACHIIRHTISLEQHAKFKLSLGTWLAGIWNPCLVEKNGTLGTPKKVFS